ncbi:MAG: ABC transporter ATP-binding protein [Candidatus Methanomethylophilaceae archaeon]
MHIKIDDIDFSYSNAPVLNDITLDLEGPQFVTILGPNGVGKSTLIHCINKVLKPTRGSVMVDEINIDDIKLKDMAKKIGYVPYASTDSFPLTVIDTVLMGRSPHSGWRSTDEDLNIVYNVLKMLHIDDLAMRSFNELSAGQHQKVMLARGLVQDPEILLLDEPTSNLDIKHQLEVTYILKDLARSHNLLVIMISHDINIASKFSDKIILLRGGTIFSIGTPQEVITEKNIKEVYGVESNIIDVDGHPHVILKRPCDESV